MGTCIILPCPPHSQGYKNKASESNKNMGKRKRSKSSSGSRKRYKRSKKTSFRKKVLNILNQNSETKWTSKATENVEMKHNGGISRAYGILPNLLQTNQGVSQSQRIGDEVNAKGIKIKIYLQNTPERRNVNYRIMVLQVPRANAGTNSLTDIFNGSMIDNCLLATVNTDYYKVIRQKIVRMVQDTDYTPGDVLRNNSKLIQMYIPMKGKKVKYGPTNDSAYPKLDKYCYSLCVTAYDNNGALLTDTLGNVSAEIRFYFKDA